MNTKFIWVGVVVLVVGAVVSYEIVFKDRGGLTGQVVPSVMWSCFSSDNGNNSPVPGFEISLKHTSNIPFNNIINASDFVVSIGSAGSDYEQSIYWSATVGGVYVSGGGSFKVDHLLSQQGAVRNIQGGEPLSNPMKEYYCGTGGLNQGIILDQVYSNAIRDKVLNTKIGNFDLSTITTAKKYFNDSARTQ